MTPMAQVLANCLENHQLNLKLAYILIQIKI